MNKQSERISRKAGLIKIAIDMHLKNYRVVRQIDGSAPNWLVLIFLGMVAILLGTEESTRVAIYVAPIWFGLLGLGYHFTRRAQLQPA
jgi:L-asparagine transporter-like permease